MNELEDRGGERLQVHVGIADTFLEVEACLGAYQ